MKTSFSILVWSVILICITSLPLIAKETALESDFTHPGVYPDRIEGDEFSNNSFVYVAGGGFTMGSPGGAEYSESDEFPAHQVNLSPFYMSKHEVTQAEYAAIMYYNPSLFASDSIKPVERVNWYNAIEYCNLLSIYKGMQPCYTYTGYGTQPEHWPHNWNTYFHNNITCDWNANGYRLPTEAEFEYAAMGGIYNEGFTYSGSNILDDVAWYGNNTTQTHSMMTKLPNQLGIYDLTGNIQEWCWDWYAPYTSSTLNDPHGPATGIYKARKGGAWDGNFTYQRICNRTYTYIMYGYEGMGFRVVRKAN